MLTTESIQSSYRKLETAIILAFVGVLLALAPAAADVAYGVGFKWTFWDPANTAHSDWPDMVKGRTAPGYWAPNPAGDAASISDPANAGKWSGTGSSSVWSVVGSANYPHMASSLAPFTTWMATQGYGWSVT
ncbi:MAG: hypothetical protein ACYC64_04750, partial [Armatimonadota bacterium]